MPHKRANWERKKINVFVADKEAVEAESAKVKEQKVVFEISSIHIKGVWTVDSAKKFAYDYGTRGKVFRIRFTDPNGVRRLIRGHTGVGRNVTAYVQGLKGLKTIPPKQPIEHLMRRKYKHLMKYTKNFEGKRDDEA